MRAATGIVPAGRAGRRLNAEDSLMVHWDRPTMFATSRHHKLQVPLLLEMVEVVYAVVFRHSSPPYQRGA